MSTVQHAKEDRTETSRRGAFWWITLSAPCTVNLMNSTVARFCVEVSERRKRPHCGTIRSYEVLIGLIWGRLLAHKPMPAMNLVNLVNLVNFAKSGVNSVEQFRAKKDYVGCMA